MIGVPLMVIGIFSFMLCAVLLVIGFLLVNSGAKFSRESKEIDATIIGYETQENYTKWDYPTLQFKDGAESVMSVGKVKHFTSKEYPPGTVLKVAYTSKYFLGARFYDVRALDEKIKPYSDAKVGAVLLYIGFALAAVAVAATVAASIFLFN